MTRHSAFLLYFICVLFATVYPGKQQKDNTAVTKSYTVNEAGRLQPTVVQSVQQQEDKPAPAAPVNEIIDIPDEPQTQGYAPTSIKDFEAADPTEGISMISTPTANSLGNAVLSFNMNLPDGRQGMNPLISISYNNEGGTTWMGTGWNLSSPAISIDTRWGVPRYDAALETEMYLLNGEQLAPVNNRDTFMPRVTDKRFYQRVEHDFNKIIRHGTGPKDYWWEVSEKNGVKNYYGGRPGQNVISAAVLKDDQQNIAYWALVESKDLYGNFVRYEYDSVSNTGLATSTVPGRQLYLGRIFYTGNGSTPAPYRLDFIRDRTLSEPQRKDVTIDARLGFKMVSADLLRKIYVSYNNDTIRSYDFKYSEGAFYKTLLTSIRELDNKDTVFYKQDFEYYDDARVNDVTKAYKPRDSSLAWQVADDHIRGNIQNPIPQFEDNASVINTAQVSSTTAGVVVTVGSVTGGVWSKKLSVGGGFSYGKDYMEEITSLIDINGDGLPDKVFKDGTSLYYRPNLGLAAHSFGDKKLIKGISAFSTSETDNLGGGLQAIPYSGFFGYNHTSSTTTYKIYFSDFNGDGLIDIASSGRVYFNHLDINGDPVFATDSKLTPSPIFSGNLDAAFTQIDTALQGKQERDFPLQDIIRCWVAPVNGTISITAPVQLVNVPNQTGIPQPRKDGVRVSIQSGPNILWSTSIGQADFTVKTPANVSGLTVTKGQRIYFRLQSVYNGEDDIVNWDPIIQYTSAVPLQSDAHHKSSNYYRASEDFILHNRSGAGMGKPGTIVIDGNFKKQKTADSVFIQIDRDRNGVITNFFQKGYGGNDSVDETVQVPGQFAVDTNDVVHFSLVSRSYIDRSAMQWAPHYAYIAFGDSTPVTTAGGAPTIQDYPVPDNSNFNNWLQQAPPVTVAQKDTVILWPQVSGGGNGALWFSVKGTDTVYARRRLFVNGGTMDPAIDSIHLIRKAGEPLFMEYATDSITFASGLATAVLMYRDSAYIDSTGAPKDTLILGGTLAANLYTNPAEEYLGPIFRGWGYFGFKGDKGNGPLDESAINLNEFNGYPADPGLYADSASLSNIPDPSKANFIMVYAKMNNQSWMGYDSSVYVTGGTMSSSRLYLHDVFVDTLPAGAGAINKVTNTETNSYSLGVSVKGIGPSGGKSDATTCVSKDMIDMNGDRYPDVVGLGTGSVFSSQTPIIQYTLPHGGLGSMSISPQVGNTVSSGYQEGLGLGGEYEKAYTSHRAAMASGGAQNTAKSSMGVSGSVNWNQDFTGSSWIDMNGDGLVDRVFDDGTVMLNLGYKFLPGEKWNFDGIDAALSLSYGGGLGINIDGGSYEGGFGISRTEGRSYHLLNDMNNDGLPDRLYLDGNEVQVSINTGNGFGPRLPWKGYSDIASIYSVGESFNLAVTAAFPIFFIKIAVNPSGNYGHGTSRQEQALMDIDGDGYADYVQSKDDGKLSASSSAIGRTNMLRTVKQPLGGSYFTMDYERLGNTYDMPQSKWVLKGFTLFDGAPGDGMDTMRSRFVYEGGRQDRHEREFYGFSKVTTRDLNVADKNKVYRSHIQQFLNTSYYNKGLLSAEWTEDSAGHKFTQTNYTYDIDSLRGYVRFPALKQTEKLYYEGGVATNTKTVVAYQYDALGNITRITDAGDGSQNDLKTTNITYHDLDNLYIKSIPSLVETITAEGQKRKRTTTLNDIGAVKRIQDFLANGTAATTDLEYDVYGNVTRLTKPANLNNQRMSYLFEYDNMVHNYPVKVTDAYGYVTTNEYDYRFGAVTRTLSRNGEPTRYTLDKHGRVVTFTGPYELAAGKPYTIAFDYHPEATVPYSITRHYDPEYNADINVYNFADGLGRSVQVKKQISFFRGKNIADDVRMVVSGTDNFDAFGRIVESYYPVMEAKGDTNKTLNLNTGKLLSKTTFDATDRIVKRILADGAATSAVYTATNGMISKTVTDALGNKKEIQFDTRGRKRLTKLFGPASSIITSRYEYDALNEIIRVVDTKGNILSATYDNMGRKTSVQHPDAGRTDFEYDLAGNLIKKITPEIRTKIPTGGAIQYQYYYNRLTQIDYPIQYQNQVKYTYGDSGVKAGRVILQQDASGGLEFFYSKQGQIIKTIRTVATSPQFNTTFICEQEYDSWNRVKKMVYPDGEEIMYHYNKGGGLQSIDAAKRGSSYRFIDRLGYDEFDQRVYMRYSNGTENYYRYDSLRRRLSELKALSPMGQAMMNNSYQYDAVSNVLGIINNKGNGNVKQDYHYDVLYRLDSATGVLSGDAGTGQYGLKIDYDNLDNITKKSMHGSGVGYDQTYTYGGAAPHQATQIGDKAYTYDLNANQTGYGDIKNYFDEENRLRGVDKNGVQSKFTYDADDIRVIKSSGGEQGVSLNAMPAGAVTHDDNYTIYVSPYVSAKKSEFTKHYYIDGERVASQLGHGTFKNISFPQSGLTAGGVDYNRRAALMEKARNDYYASLGISPGPPTDKNFWARPENSGIAAPVFTDTTASNVPPGWPGNTTPPPNGPPVFVSAVPSRDSVKAGYGFEDAGQFYEGGIYFYHFGNSGSTNYVTNFNGEVIQHVEYAPSGEIFFNEHAGLFETKYLFNAKNLDDETGYYYYSPQYYDPVLSQWLNVADPGGEGFLGAAVGAYSVTGDNGDDDIVSNPVISKIAYSGSASPETIWSDKSYGSNSDEKKTSKDQMRKVNNKARRKIVANRYANNLSDFRYNRGDGGDEDPATHFHNVLENELNDDAGYDGADAINIDEDMGDNDMDGNRGTPTRARRNATLSKLQNIQRQRSNSVVSMHGFQQQGRRSTVTIRGLQRIASNSIVNMHGFQRQRNASNTRTNSLSSRRSTSSKR